jgi:hypothetical protein
MISWKDLTVQQERYKDFAREVESDKLVDRAVAGSGRKPFYATPLAWLGARLSATGGFLQRRYGRAASETVPAKAMPLASMSLLEAHRFLTASAPSEPGRTDLADIASHTPDANAA